VLLPSDTYRRPNTSITVVQLPFVTYLLTHPPIFHIPGKWRGVVCVCNIYLIILFSYLELHMQQSFLEANSCCASHVWKQGIHYVHKILSQGPILTHKSDLPTQTLFLKTHFNRVLPFILTFPKSFLLIKIYTFLICHMLHEKIITAPYYQMHYQVHSIPASYFGGSRFESWPGDQLS
jgi:hypothetical protein